MLSCTLFTIVCGEKGIRLKSEATDVVLGLRTGVVWVVEANAVHVETSVWVDTFC